MQKFTSASEVSLETFVEETGHTDLSLLARKGASIVHLVSELVREAHRLRASDIHIEPREHTLRVRLRIDGALIEKFVCDKNIHSEIIARIKVLSGLRTDEHHAAQDGRFRIASAGSGLAHAIDIRVSITPTYYGENAVLRLLGNNAEEFTLARLGFSEHDQLLIRRAISRPHGMILSTGPTGSGKTTTLYTLIKMLSTVDVSIVTIEDPIEHAMPDITQIQIDPRSGLNFANGLRSILRQDPNIIMVGEIRDTETARIAVNTALTGHLLLSTLHTNDAATTLPRLLDMGIDPYLVASTVNIAIGHRLVRRICGECKQECALTVSERESLKEIMPDLAVSQKFFKGKGCLNCGDTGYCGRIGVNEVLWVNEAVREAILAKASAATLKALAVEGGMIPMIKDAVQKAKQGDTTISEILRTIHE